MSKYIGFDIDCKKVVACVVENGKRDIYETLGPDVGSMRKFLLKQKQSGDRVELAFEIGGEAGFIMIRFWTVLTRSRLPILLR